MDNVYYVYVYLDPRNMGKYIYGHYSFKYEPIYVGNGKGLRYNDHIQENELNKSNGNFIKQNKLKKIIKEGSKPIILFIKQGLSEEQALLLEKDVILNIGRIITKTGPLTNLTDGGDGVNGRLITDEFRLKQSERMKQYYKENPLSKETNKKISDTLKSKKMVRSDKTKEKIGNANRGRVYNHENLLKIKEIRKGPKLTHRKKYILINPNNENFQILGKEELINFITENGLSIRKMIASINKGVIKLKNVRLTKNNGIVKTKNCVGWEIIKK